MYAAVHSSAMSASRRGRGEHVAGQVSPSTLGCHLGRVGVLSKPVLVDLFAFPRDGTEERVLDQSLVDSGEAGSCGIAAWLSASAWAKVTQGKTADDTNAALGCR